MLSRAIVGYNVFVGYSKNQQKAFYLMIALESMKLFSNKVFLSKILTSFEYFVALVLFI